MFRPFTEVIFIDEADENSLDISDWKLHTQGGYATHDVNYQTERAFINKCPLLITAQHKLQFSTVHKPVDQRLLTYHFKRLTNPKKKGLAWLRKHPMECIVWATEQAKRRAVDTESDDSDSDDQNDAQNVEGSLQQKQKEDLRTLSLTDPPEEEAKSGEAEASEEEYSTAGMEQSDADEVNELS